MLTSEARLNEHMLNQEKRLGDQMKAHRSAAIIASAMLEKTIEPNDIAVCVAALALANSRAGGSNEFLNANASLLVASEIRGNLVNYKAPPSQDPAPLSEEKTLPRAGSSLQRYADQKVGAVIAAAEKRTIENATDEEIAQVAGRLGRNAGS
jgi:hypothetical protein